jgi:hypothetical protein
MTTQAMTTGVPQGFFDFRTYSRERVERLASEFSQARPFPHVVLPNFLSLTPGEAAGVFPAPDWPHWNRRQDFYQSGKMYCRDTDVIPPTLASMLGELSSPPFLAFLEALTGIRGLIPDPYLEGGGLHCSGPGGVLMPHPDFHFYGRLDLYRRVNLLLYLNPVWEEGFGGCLELWEKGASRPSKLVVPAWGTCVIFRTDDDSVHGFSTPVGEGHWRRSVALYYYTGREAARFSGDGYTYWRRHGAHGGLGRLRAGWFRLLTRAAHKLSYVAHRANPDREPREPPK